MTTKVNQNYIGNALQLIPILSLIVSVVALWFSWSSHNSVIEYERVKQEQDSCEKLLRRGVDFKQSLRSLESIVETLLYTPSAEGVASSQKQLVELQDSYEVFQKDAQQFVAFLPSGILSQLSSFSIALKSEIDKLGAIIESKPNNLDQALLDHEKLDTELRHFAMQCASMTGPHFR